MTAFQATYSDLRIVKGRKMVQIVLEVNQESADAALAVLGGLPRPDSPVWVGVARLNHKAAVEPPQAEEKPKRRFDELPLPQQAALLCQDERFQEWMLNRATGNLSWSDGEDREVSTANWLRQECRVKSRADIIDGTDSGESFRYLLFRYREQTGQLAEVRG